MKRTVASFAPAECLLVPTCSLAIFKRQFFVFLFFLEELALQKAVKAARHTLQQPDQWNESGLQCAGCLGISAGMRLLKYFFPDSCISSTLIQILWFPSLFVSVESITHSLCAREALSSLSGDWHSWWCLSLLSLTFNSQERTHKHAHQARTARLLMDPSVGFISGEKQCPFTEGSWNVKNACH